MMNSQKNMDLAKKYLISGNLKEAEILYREILEAEPNNVNALHFIGIIYFHNKKYNEAIQYLRKTLSLAPNYADAHNNLGRIHQDMGNLAEAMLCYQNAIHLNPNFVQAYVNLSIVHQEKGQLDEAIGYLQKAISINPNLFDLYNNLGVLLQTNGQFKEAMSCHEKSLQLNPNFVEAYVNLGITLQATGQLDKAMTYFQKALMLAPENANANYNYSLALLMAGNYKEGWGKFEWRREIPELSYLRAPFTQPLWDGRDLTGRTILLLGEQGFGDMIQFVRYVPLVAERNARIAFICPKELKPLFKNNRDIYQIIEYGETLPSFDVYCPLLSLPFIFGTTLETIPDDIPYLHVDEESIQRWKHKQKDDTSQYKIGLVWSGNPTNIKLAHKSCTLKHFSPLSEIKNTTFYSLQKGEASQESKNPPEGMKFIDYTNEINDFYQTAALIMTLDLIISVDTAVAHLSGALGKPVWTLLSSAADWRWMFDRDNNSWYPTMKLYRQSIYKDWTSIIINIKNDLAQYFGNT